MDNVLKNDVIKIHQKSHKKIKIQKIQNFPKKIKKIKNSETSISDVLNSAMKNKNHKTSIIIIQN